MESRVPFCPQNVSVHELFYSRKPSMMARFQRGPLVGSRVTPTAYAKSQIVYEVVCCGDEKWGSRSPVFQKTSVISAQLTYQNVKSFRFQGAQPLGGGWGGAPKKLCVHRRATPRQGVGNASNDNHDRKHAGRICGAASRAALRFERDMAV